MENNDIIFDIVSHLMEGTITPEEKKQLDVWLDENPQNKLMLDKFMQRNDLLEIYRLPRQHRDGRPQFDDTSNSWAQNALTWFKRAGIAASIVLVMGVGIKWWKDYSRVTPPQITESTIAAMQMAKQSGHSDAEVSIHAVNEDNSNADLATNVSVDDESALSALCNKLNISDETNGEDLGNMVADIVTRHDKEFWMTLPDGSRVHLNYNSSLTYPLAFTGDKREVTLEGEAFFFVTTDHRHPFVVHTVYGDVKEYGTEFCVNTRYNSRESVGVNGIRGKGMSVVLVKGSISVNPYNKAEYMMKPNDLALVTSRSSEPRIKQVDTTPFTSWNTGTFTFDECPLERLISVIGKWHEHTVTFTDDKLRHIKFTGDIDKYESLENIISSLSKSTSTDITIKGKQIIVGK